MPENKIINPKSNIFFMVIKIKLWKILVHVNQHNTIEKRALWDMLTIQSKFYFFLKKAAYKSNYNKKEPKQHFDEKNKIFDLIKRFSSI